MNTSKNTFYVTTRPNPRKFIESMRSINYDNYYACMDIADNSVDADATKIQFILSGEKTKLTAISIVDNGYGMDADTLLEAVKFGSETPHEHGSDLGRFGMGLCTASLSLGKRFTILTKCQDGELLKVVHDIDFVKETNEFCCNMPVPSSDDVKQFNDLVANDSGTIVVIDKLDRLQRKTITSFQENLANHVSQVFRYFVSSSVDKSISVNGEKIEPSDPLMWDDPDTNRLTDEEFDYKYEHEGEKHSERIRVRIALLPEKAIGIATGAKKRNTERVGFYVVRNEREIASGVTFGLFMKHNSLLAFRGEVRFSGGDLDTNLQLNLQKNGIVPPQGFVDKLEAIVKPYLKTARDARATIMSQRADIKKVHETVKEEVKKKAKLLKLPEGIREKRKSPTRQENKKEGTKIGGTREPNKNTQKGLADLVEFEHRSMGASGHIFESAKSNRKVIVTLNTDHPFFEKFYVDRKDTPAAIDTLLYCWALGELEYWDENNGEMMLNVKSIISNNFRVMLS